MGLAVEQIEEIYQRRYAGFRRGVAAIAGDWDAAHDIVQEGFAQALDQRRRCRGTNPEAWVWRIVERRAFDEVRRRRGRNNRFVEALDPELVPAERNQELAAAIRMLPTRRRLVVFLRYFADLSYGDIARLCRMSEGTVAATLAQAHQDLRKLLTTEEARS